MHVASLKKKKKVSFSFLVKHSLKEFMTRVKKNGEGKNKPYIPILTKKPKNAFFVFTAWCRGLLKTESRTESPCQVHTGLR